MSDKYIVVVHDEERRKEIIQVFGTDEVYIKSPIKTAFRHELTGEIFIGWYVDLDMYDDAVKNRLVKNIAERFKIPVDEVRVLLPKLGVPIKDTDATLILKEFSAFLE